MAARAPLGFDVAFAIGESGKSGISFVVIIVIVGAGIGVLIFGGEAEGLDVSAGKTNSDDRLGGVDSLAEELRGEGELA